MAADNINDVISTPAKADAERSVFFISELVLSSIRVSLVFLIFIPLVVFLLYVALAIQRFINWMLIMFVV